MGVILVVLFKAVERKSKIRRTSEKQKCFSLLVNRYLVTPWGGPDPRVQYDRKKVKGCMRDILMQHFRCEAVITSGYQNDSLKACYSAAKVVHITE